MNRILLVDDEHDLVWAIGHSLRDEGFEVFTAYDGAEAMISVRRYHPDLVVLDVNMPRMDGLQVCRQLRRDPTLAAVPILFLTERNAITDRVSGLDTGADDYLGKPIDLRELKSRIRALLRRTPAGARQQQATPVREVLTYGPIEVDVKACEVRVGGRVVRLTPAEFDLLHHLMTHPGQVFSSQQLLQQVWGYPPDTAESSLVRWHVMNLRAKIEADPSKPSVVVTVARYGYRCGAETPWINTETQL
ncbi:MAG: hypothetical protein RLZZ387_1102 [Chloroflexota bacterium]|jgi:DNA-binding response OmpR family regulator